MKHKYNLYSFTNKKSMQPGVLHTLGIAFAMFFLLLANTAIAQPLVSLDSIRTTDISCSGYGDGIAEVFVSPSTGTYDYSVDGGTPVVGGVIGGYAQIGSLSPGPHTIVVTDGTNSFSGTVSYTNPDPLDFSFVIGQTPGCAGQLGSISVNITGGTIINVPYYNELYNSGNVLMNPFPDNYITTFNNLASDSYTLTVQDEVGCSLTKSINLPNLCLFIDQEISCTGYNDGKIQASTATLPTSPNVWNYTLNGNPLTTNTSGLFINIPPGTHTVCMTDNVNTYCNTVTFIEPDPLAAFFIVDSTVSCLGNDGALSIDISGGTIINQDYLTTWSPGMLTNDIFDRSVGNLTVGSYTVNIEDEVGCTLEISTTLLATPPMQISASYLPIACAGGTTSVSASAINGVPPFTFTANGNPLPASLSAGSYTITGTDSKGCTGTTVLTITQPAGVSFSIQIDSVTGCSPTEFGGLSATISGGTGPYMTQWRNSSNVLLNPSPNNFNTFVGGLTSGIYSLTVTDASGCSSTQSIYLPNLCLFKDQDISCFGFNDGYIQVSTNTPGGPWTYSRDAGAVTNLSGTFTGLVPGVHTFCATNGVLTFCDTMSVYEPMPLVVDSFVVDSTVSCLGNDGAMSIYISGGSQDNQPYILTWTPSATVFDIYDNSAVNLIPGTYTVDIEDDRGCLLSATQTLGSTPPMVVTATYTAIVCNGGTTNVSASATNAVAPVTYTANGNPLPANLIAGTYTIVATDVKGCTGSTVITITQPTPITGATSADVCDTYTWASPTGNGNTYTLSGNYTHTMMAANGCDSVITLSLTIRKSSYANFTVCAANQYTWAVSGTNYTTAGTYTHTLAGANAVGCDSILTLNLTLIPMTLFKDQDVSCFGFNDGYVVATVNLPGTWTYTRDSLLLPNTTGQFPGLTPGTHTICATMGSGNCLYCDTVTILEPLPLVIDSFTVDSTVSCLGNDGAMTVYVSGGSQDNQPYLITWSPSATVSNIYDNSATGLSLGTYTVDIEDDRGCLLSGTNSISATPDVVVTAISTPIACFGAQTPIDATSTGGLAPIVHTIGATVLPANFSAGTYTIVGTDVKGCTGSTVITITEPNAITSTFTLTACDSYTWALPNGNGNTYTLGGVYSHTMSAMNGCDSVITLSLAVNYSSTSSVTQCAANQYTWPVSGVNYTAAGSYTHTLVGANAVGCDSIITLNLSLISMTLFKDQDVSCFGFNDGYVVATVNAPGSWTYTRDSLLLPNTSGQFPGLTPGTHTICATMGSGNCLYCDTVTILEPLPLVVDSFQVDSTVSCLGNDGAMTVYISGGSQDNQPYLITWLPSATVNDIYDNSATGLSVGTYTVNIEDDRGCLLTATQSIGLTLPPVITAVYTPIACAGGSTTVDAISVNGVAPFVHTIGVTTLPAVFSAGTYTIVSTDAKGCTGTTEITITQPTVATLNIPQTACDTYTWNAPGNGITYTNTGNYSHTLLAANGCDSVVLNLNLTVNYSSASFDTAYAANTYTWAVNGVTYTNSGNYTFTVPGTNAAGCDTFVHLNLNLIPLTLFVNQHVSCFGNNDGFVEVNTVAPGTWVYYRDAGLDTNALGQFPGLTPGLHTFCAFDGVHSYCDTVSINEPNPLVASFIVDSTVSCLGNDGALTLVITGGTADIEPYKTTWSAGVTTATIYDTYVTGLAIGGYTVTIEDDNGCFLTVDTVLGFTPPIVITPTLGTIPCSGGNATIDATATGGLAPITFAIGGTPLPANFVAGTYTITGTDVKGCTGTLEVTLTQPPIFTNTDSVTICGSYLWPVNGQTYTNSGTYTETFFTSAGCDSAQSVVLTILPITSSVENVVIANTYTWIANGVTYTNSGIYTATLVGANQYNCDSTLTLNLQILNMAIVVNQHVSCNGNNDGSIDVTTTGGSGVYVYSIDGGSYASYVAGHIPGLAPGTHTICAKELPSNAVICDTITISQPAVLSVTLTVDSTVSCYGNDGKLTATITGGTTVNQPYLTTWASGVTTNSIYQTTVSGLAVGIYTITVEDDNLCFATATVSLTATPPVTVTASNTPIVCNGGTSVISFTSTGGTGALNTVISGGSYTVSAGTYTLTATDALGCTGTTVVNVTEPALLHFFDTVIHCDSYTWAPNNTTYTLSGNYTATYTSVNGCDSSYFLNLIINYSSSSVENVTVANTYTWIANGVTYTNSGTYTHTLTNAVNCDSNLTLNLAILNFDVALNQHVSCFGANDGSADAIATGGSGNFEYSVDGGTFVANINGFFPGLAPGTHTICAREIPSNVVMCDTVTITEPTQLSVVITADSTVSCLGNDGVLTATITGGTTVNQPWLTTWASGVTTTSIHQTTVSGLAVGVYTVTVEDDNLCFATATYTLGLTPPIVVNATNAPITCFGGSTTIVPSATGGTGIKTFAISGGSFTVVAGTYTITATDEKGCTGTVEYTITQPALITTTEVVDSCDSFTWLANNVTYTMGGTYTASFVSAANCDSVAILNLTIRHSSSSTENVIVANQYNWIANGVNYTLTGVYTHTLSNAVGCDSLLTLNLTILNMTLQVNQHVSCNGNNDGSVNVDVTGGGSGNFEYSVDGGAYAPYFGGTVTGLAPGTHTICAKEIPSNVVLCDTITITQPNALSVVLTVDSTVSCLGNDGALLATISGGTAILQPYLTTWSAGVSPSSLYATYVTGLTVGTYTVTVEDDNLCFATATITLGSTAPIVVDATQTTMVCNGETAVVMPTSTGGTGAKTYAISGGTFTVTAGSYTITATDTKGCTGSTVFTVTEPAVLTSTQVEFAAAPFLWTNGVTYTATGLYTHTFTSQFGCDSIATLDITFAGVRIAPRVFLQGAYVEADGKMHDKLRQQNLVPNNEPYSNLPFNSIPILDGNPAEKFVSAAILAKTGDSAVVDWVLVELRNGSASGSIVATKRALVLRNGAVVSSVDGASSLFFPQNIPGNYFVSIKHRNHLGVMTLNALPLTAVSTSVDFTSLAPVYVHSAVPPISNPPRKTISGVNVLWLGDANANKNTKYNGSANDKQAILDGLGGNGNATVVGYRIEDVNMDGIVKYNNTDNDKNHILNNVMTISFPNAVYYQHTPN